jgi:hypothetical protein
LRRDGKTHEVYAHRLVHASFRRRPAKVVAHRNHDGTDNRLVNLKGCTQAENLRDSIRDGRIGRILAPADVHWIRSLTRRWPVCYVARLLGKPYMPVWRAAWRRTWTCLR